MSFDRYYRTRLCRISCYIIQVTHAVHHGCKFSHGQTQRGITQKHKVDLVLAAVSLTLARCHQLILGQAQGVAQCVKASTGRTVNHISAETAVNGTVQACIYGSGGGKHAYGTAFSIAYQVHAHALLG